jgi:hypothetical protein
MKDRNERKTRNSEWVKCYTLQDLSRRHEFVNASKEVVQPYLPDRVWEPHLHVGFEVITELKMTMF